MVKRTKKSTDATKVSSGKGTRGRDKKSTSAARDEEAVAPPVVDPLAQDQALLHEKNEELRQDNEMLKDKFLRHLAEFDNYKKRTDRDFGSLQLYANEQLVKELLPIIDDMERSLRHPGDNKTALREGNQLIYDKFMNILSARGISRIQAEGAFFSTDEHEALMQMEKEGVEPNTVVEVYEQGYKLHDKVIRHAKVVVSK